MILDRFLRKKTDESLRYRTAIAMHVTKRKIDTTFRDSNQVVSDGIVQLKADWKLRKQIKAEKDIDKKLDKLNRQKTDDQLFGEIISHDALALVQKSVISLYKNDYSQSLRELKQAKNADVNLDVVYLYHYLIGYINFKKGSFLKSILGYKRALELMENPEDDDDQVEMCKIVEMAIIEIEYKMKHTFDKIKEYFNDEKNEKNEKEACVVSVEELRYHLGVSYFTICCYSEAIDQLSSAISSLELLERNPDINNVLALAYYYRGYSYFSSHQFLDAINDFTISLEFNQDEKVKQMLNNSMKEIGQEPNEICTIPPPTIYHYRLISEESTRLIFGFLRIQTLIYVAKTCKYWKQLAMKSLSDGRTPFFHVNEFIEKQRNALYNANSNISKWEKKLLPKRHEIDLVEILRRLLKTSFFKDFTKTPQEVHVVSPKLCSLFPYILNCKKLYYPWINFNEFLQFPDRLEQNPVEELFLFSLPSNPGDRFTFKEFNFEIFTHYTHLKHVSFEIRGKEIVRDLSYQFTVLLPQTIELFEYHESAHEYMRKFVIPNNPHITFRILEEPIKIPLPAGFIDELYAPITPLEIPFLSFVDSGFDIIYKSFIPKHSTVLMMAETFCDV